MEPMDTQTKLGIMAKLRNSKGFSLIEMAIVLVIIGIIIGAIIKGQDLITNSQAKKVTSAVTSWRNLTMAFLDRNGRFPGDQNKNGIIADQAAAGLIVEETTNATSAIAEIVGVMEQVPDNPIILGSSSFYVYMGNTNIGTVLAPIFKNTILICADVACANVFSTDQLELIKAVDTAIDGYADAGVGTFRAVATAPTLAQAATAVGGRFTTTFSGVAALTVAPIVLTQAGTPTAWGAHRAAVYLFDKTF